MQIQLLLSLLLCSVIQALPGNLNVSPIRVSQPRYVIDSGKMAEVVLVPGSDDGVSGRLKIFTQPGFETPVHIEGSIFGLKSGFHGFHVHMNGELGNQCKDAGGHFNPLMMNHSSPESPQRHAGDLGNILTESDYAPTFVAISDDQISLGDGGMLDIAGRSIVVHEKEDDLGMGDDAESLKTGNAGSRLACGVINLLN